MFFKTTKTVCLNSYVNSTLQIYGVKIRVVPWTLKLSSRRMLKQRHNTSCFD